VTSGQRGGGGGVACGAANRRGVQTKSSGRDDDAGTPTGQRGDGELL